MALKDDYRYDDHFKDHVLTQVLDADKFKAFYLKNPKYGRMESCMILFSPEGINILGDLCPGNDPRNSGVHASGYGLDWFAGGLSSSYLCEKFLGKEWHQEIAEEDCRVMADEIMKGETGHFDRDRELEDTQDERIRLAEELRDLLSDRRNKLAEPKDVKIEAKVIRARGRVLRERLLEQRTVHASKYLHLARMLDGGDMGVETFCEAMHEIHRDFYEDCPGYGYHPRSKYLLVAIQKKFSELYHKLQPATVGA